MDKKIVAIACGLCRPKKDFDVISKRNLYLNYGLLGLCTILKAKGYDIMQFQGEYLKPDELIQTINRTEYNLKNIKYPVLLSIVSFLSLEWCYEITKILKEGYGIKCIVGGKYVLDGNIQWLKAKLPYVDLFIEGAGENKIEDALLLGQYKKDNELSEFYYTLNFSLIHDYKKYNPSIELSRGCVYCADGMRKRSAIKNAESVIQELRYIEKLYDYEKLNLYYQMATFQVDSDWIKTYQKYIGQLSRIIEWRCTTRIDTVNLKALPKLAEIGLRVMDLGLESASPRQLLLMKKTNTPKEYLKKAEEILHVAFETGIWIKLNILLTAGETKETVEETKSWLDKNKRYIKGISSNCETLYGPYNDFVEKFKTLGVSLVECDALVKKGYSYINLSKEMTYELAKKYALELSRDIMGATDYFDLKKFGYFPRDYQIEEFLKDIQMIEEDNLPFNKGE